MESFVVGDDAGEVLAKLLRGGEMDRVQGTKLGRQQPTGRPRSVTSIVSPPATRRSSSLARCRSSRTPTLAMRYL